MTIEIDGVKLEFSDDVDVEIVGKKVTVKGKQVQYIAPYIPTPWVAPTDPYKITYGPGQMWYRY